MSNVLDSILKQYENNNSSGNGSKKTYDLKNYFNTGLKDGVNSAIKRIRILPNNGKSPFVEMMGHKAQVGGEWKTFPCLKHEENKPCPFCEAREALLSTGKESDKELAKKYSAKKIYVVKVIDRGAEEEGVKFWRFNHDYRKTGTFDKIAGVLQAIQQDITDSNTGRDLVININRDQNKKPAISSIVQGDPSPLSKDAQQAESWVNDTRTWRDVYSMKSYEYLEIVVKGGVPMFDKASEKWVDKATLSTDTTTSDNLDSELSMGAAAAKTSTPVTTVITTASKTETPAAADEDDDLPF